MTKKREPVASPQAARCESGWSGTPHHHEGLCFADISPTAQPAAGTTPCNCNQGNGLCAVHPELLPPEGVDRAVAPVETRLTAEQFWKEVMHFPKEVIRKLTMWECEKLDQIIIESLDAFRDKSEAGLLNALERLYQWCPSLEGHPNREEYEADLDRAAKIIMGVQSYGRGEAAESEQNKAGLSASSGVSFITSSALNERPESNAGLREEIERLKGAHKAICIQSDEYCEQLKQTNDLLTELRAKLAEQERIVKAYMDASGDLKPEELDKVLDSRFDKMGLNQLTDAVESVEELRERADAAEAEAAALRERERWIPVSERLPEIGQEVYAGAFITSTFADGRQTTSWQQTLMIWDGRIWRDSESGDEDGASHWKALSAAPERGKDGKS